MTDIPRVSDLAGTLRVASERLPRTRRWTSVRVALPAIVVTGFLARLVAVSGHRTPRLFPDEYIYATLARSLSGGSLTIRGGPAHFPAVLEPLVAAPLWWTHDPSLVYRLTQGLNAAAMTLVAVPIFHLARRLRLPQWQALACSAFAVALPALLYSAYITADALGFLVAATAIVAGVRCLDAPTRRAQALFLALALAATLARVQYVVLPAAFVAAAIVVERGPRAALVRYRPTFGSLSAVAVVALAAGPRRVLGYYDSILHQHLAPLTLLHWIAVDAFLLALAAGVVVVPATVAGLVAGLRRDAPRSERAFVALVGLVAVALLLEAAVYASTTDRFQERYLMALLPFFPVAAALGWRMLPRGRIAVVATGAALVVAVARVPLSGFTVLTNRQDSPFLFAVAEAEHHLGFGTGSLVVSVAAALLAAAAMATALRPRLVPALTAIALLALAGTSVAAVASDRSVDRYLRATLPTDSRWIDRRELGRVDVVVTPGTARAQVSNDLFWNTSLRRVVQLPGTEQVDSFAYVGGTIGKDGTLAVAGATEHRAFLLEEYGSSATVAGATRLGGEPGASLWLPTGHVRVTSLAVGRYLDGWLAQQTAITVWKRRATALRLRVSLPRSMPVGQTLVVEGPTRPLTVVLRPGRSRTLTIDLGSARPAHVLLSSRRPFSLPDGRLVSAVSTRVQLLETKP